MSKSKLPHFTELDGLRGLAALAVFVHHFFQGKDNGSWLLRLTRYGANGVDVFFVLSGFLITSLLLIDREDPNYFHNFYWKRALRILPVYFIFLILTRVLIGSSAWPYIGLSLIFLANFANKFHIGTESVAWTLSIEEQFYLIWPNVVRRIQPKSLYYIASGLVLASMLLRIIVPLVSGKMQIMYTPYRCDGLGLGALLALQWFEPAKVPRFIRAFNSNAALIVAVIAAAVIVFLPEWQVGTLGARICAVNYFAYRFIHQIIKPNHSVTWLGRGVPVYLGRISYSLYLYHPFVLFMTAKYVSRLPAQFCIALAGSIAMSSLSLYAMEQPIQKLRRFVLRSTEKPSEEGRLHIGNVGLRW